MSLLLRLQAGLARRFRRHAAATRLYEQALASAPDDPRLLGRLGQCRAEAGDEAGALMAFRRLAEVTPDKAGAHYNIGYLLDRAGDEDGALAAFDRALQLEPLLDRAWFGRGLILRRRGRGDEAVAALQKSISANPTAAEAWLQLGELHLERREDPQLDGVILQLRSLQPNFAWRLMQAKEAATAAAGTPENEKPPAEQTPPAAG
ncbi:MAG: tetratricopeptide repeat protein [Verrucomicrobia bacterium]|nr:tetratricopeptide repeat protein [Verrucomicrobiota bacterium]